MKQKNQDKIYIGEIDEIKDFMEMNTKEEVAQYIYNLEKECKKLDSALKVSRNMLENRVTKDRYNDLVNKYNKLVKEKKKND